jgi:hypothetical protein
MIRGGTSKEQADSLCCKINNSCVRNYLDKNIKILVKKGLSTDTQKSLDYVRLTGNNAVHPLERIVITDTKKNSNSLFEPVYFIVDKLITRHKKIDRLYGSLPRKARSRIKEGDKPENQKVK